MRKRIFLIGLLILMFTSIGVAALTNTLAGKKRNPYWFTRRPKDTFSLWADEMEDLIDGTTGQNFLFCAPDSVADQTDEGTIYYDSDTDGLYYRNASGWVTIAASTSSTLDEAYDAGATIDVDGTALTLTTSNPDDNVVLAIVQNEADNDNDALTITFGTNAIGKGILINSQSGGTDIAGDNWSIDQAGKLTILEIAQTGDVLFNGTTYDVAFDASREGIVVEDNAIIGFGAGTHDDAPDLTISGTGTNVNVEVATEDLADLIFGATNALDILIHNDAADSLITFDCSAEMVELNGWDLRVQDLDVICFGDTSDWTLQSSAAKKLKATPATGDGSDSFDIGANTAGADFQLFGADTSGAYCLWDSTADALWFDKADIALGQTDYILFGDTMGTGDISMGCSANDVFTIGQVVADAGAVFFGVADDGIDTTFYGDASGGYMKWTEAGHTSGALYFSDAHLGLDDESLIYFGSALGTGVFTMGQAANVLSITQVADGTGAIAFSADGEGMDVKFYGDTGSSFLHFDEDYGTNGALLFDVINCHIGDGDELQFGDLANDGDFTISDEADVWTFAQGTADTGTVTWGADGAGMDCTWYGESASAYLKWDATSADQLLLVGVDNSGTLLSITGADVSGDSDTILATHRGDGDFMQVTLAEPAGVGLNIVGDAAGTHPAINIDLETGAWVGAATTGAIEVTNDGLLVADASLLRLENKGKIAVANDGACLEVIDSGAATGTSYAVRIAATSNEALHVDTGLVLIDESLTISLNLAVTGDATIGGSITGDGGDELTGYLWEVEVETGTAEQLLVADSGQIFANTAAQGKTTFTLPDAAAGLWYIIADNSTTGGDDVAISPQAGDKIDDDTAGDDIQSSSDDSGCCIIFAVDGVNWRTIQGEAGTWSQD